MKRTNYTVMTMWSMTRSEYRRVYTDTEGKRYIREGKGYKCIESLPCINYITLDE